MEMQVASTFCQIPYLQTTARMLARARGELAIAQFRLSGYPFSGCEKKPEDNTRSRGPWWGGKRMTNRVHSFWRYFSSQSTLEIPGHSTDELE